MINLKRILTTVGAVALCAGGGGAALALASSGDTDTLNNVNAKEVITAKTTGKTALFKGSPSGATLECESSGGIETSVVKQPLPYTATVNKPPLSFGPCELGVTVKVNGSTEMRLESGNTNRETDGDNPPDETDEADNDTATLIVPATSSIVIDVPFPACTITISGQSFTGVLTEDTESANNLVFNKVAVPYSASGSGCSSLGVNTPTGTGEFTATYHVTPESLDDLS